MDVVTGRPTRRDRRLYRDRRKHIGLAFAGAALIGLAAGAGGVLLDPQIEFYQLDKSAIGLLFFATSVGYLLAGATTGAVLRRSGARGNLMLGTAVSVISALGCATEPPFWLLLAWTVVFGFGNGAIDASANAHLAAFPNPTHLLNMLHAFFGVGALVGPVLATQMLDAGFSWGGVYLLLGLLTVPLMTLYASVYPGPNPTDRRLADDIEVGSDGRRRSPLVEAVRHRAVALATIYLILYVGAEATLGNWSYLFVVEDRDFGPLLAGWAVSGYWIGLTLGRFVLGAAAARLGLGPVGLARLCLVGLAATAMVVWLAPTAPVAVVGLILLGSFLGPIFPLMITILPRLAPARLVPTAIGVLVGASVIGGSVFPWLAGVLADGTGLWTLLPYTAGLAVLMGLTWRAVTRPMID